MQIETANDVTLKSQRLKIENLGFKILNYSKQNSSIGIANLPKEKIASFEARLNEYIETQDNVGKTYFSALETLTEIPLENKINVDIDYESPEPVSIVMNLFNQLTSKEKFVISKTILDEIREVASDVKYQDFMNGVSSIECSIPANRIPSIVSDYSTIREIQENRIFIVEASLPADPLPNPLKIGVVESDSAICIIDSGIASANGILDGIIADVFPALPPKSVDAAYDHGTFVASRCAFGDSVDNCLGTHELTPYCNVIDAQVFGVDLLGNPVYPTELDLRTSIQNIVTTYQDTVKVYNLSLGAASPIADYSYSELAKLLDYLSKEYKVLFVIAAGNINSLLGTFPSDHFGHNGSRIGCPAESLLALTVGSIAKFENATALSNSNTISPFSRIGPGADLGIKPEVVAHGGNLIAPYSNSPRVSTYGISKDGTNLSVDNGTSFAAPIISQYAQKLFDLYPDSNPNLIKALLCHFCETREIHDEIVDSSTNYIGFGEPNIANAIEATGNNAAYIFEGELNQTEYQKIVFHVPESLAADQDSKLKVKLTITYDPSVNPNNDLEYSNTRISANLFKPDSQEMKKINITGEEKYSKPWNPIIQFEKSFSRSYNTGLWELRLRLYTRGITDENYLQNYAVVIEVIDDNSLTNVYTDILEMSMMESSF